MAGFPGQYRKMPPLRFNSGYGRQEGVFPHIRVYRGREDREPLCQMRAQMEALTLPGPLLGAAADFCINDPIPLLFSTHRIAAADFFTILLKDRFIAADDIQNVGILCAFQKFVVIWIAADYNAGR